ncbi:MAG: flagellar export protein FliJ [Phycisphaerae bacterium]|jgi:flagellar biosynthesis chaperone FliJ
MRKFVWRLQKVLDVNEKKQQAKQVELFQVTEKLALTRANLFAQKRMLRDLIEKVAADKDENRFHRQQLLLKSTKHNDELIKKHEQEIVRLEQLRKQLMEEFLKLKKSTEALEKLREQHKRKFIAEQEKLEQKESDEHTSMRFARLSAGK